MVEKDGTTRYRDYGRYGPDKQGAQRSFPTPRVEFGSNGLPTKASLQKLLAEISKTVGRGGSVEGAYFRTTQLEDVFMRIYMDMRRTLDDETPYDTLTNSCQTFCAATLFQGGQLQEGQFHRALGRPISAIQYLQELSDFALRYEHNRREEKVEIKCDGIDCELPE